MSNRPRKATSILLMAIMVAGGMTFAFPHTSPAMAQQSNPNLVVSAENSTFDNYMSGPQVIEVVIVDPDIDETNEAKGEPDVTINGQVLRMNQATDGKWYAYFASQVHADRADDTADTIPGEGLDFGGICTNTEASNLFTTLLPGIEGGYFSDSDGVALPNDASCTDATAYAGDGQVLNVVREAKAINTNSQIERIGQTLGAFASATAVPDLNAEDIWPFIQLYTLNETGNVIIQYNRGGGTQSVTLTFDTVEDFAKLELDRSKYPNAAQVHFDITDTWLNIDPTDEDSWTWDVEGPGEGRILYQQFDESGTPQNTTAAVPNIANAISNLMCDTNCVLTLDRSANGPTDIVNYNDNTDSNLGIAVPDTTEQLITVTESSASSGIFTSYDENDDSVLVTVPGTPPRGTTATIDYNETPQSILLEYSFATIDIQPTEDVWASGQEIPVVLTDADANRNTRADEDLSIVNPTDLIPTLVTGSPQTIDNFDVRTFSSAPTSVGDNNDNRDKTVIPIDMRGTIVADATDRFITFVGDIADQPSTVTRLVNYDFRSTGATGVGSVTVYNSAGTATITPSPAISGASGVQGTFELRTSEAVGGITFALVAGSEFGYGADRPIVFDVMTFGFSDDGEDAGERVADQIVRLELEENGDNTGVFVGSLEYAMANQINILDRSTFTGLALIDDTASLFVIEDLTDEDTLTVTYNDLGRDGVTTPVSDDEAAPSHSGSVSFDSTSYKIADTVTVTLRDADLNVNSDTIEVYTIPGTQDYVGAAGLTPSGANYSESYNFGIQGRLLDITFDDVAWEENTCDPPIGFDNGLRATTFTLIETSNASGIFEGDFQIPPVWCREGVGNQLNSPESVTGLDLEVNYLDYRDASGEIIEVGDGAGIRANTGSVSLDRTVYPVPFGAAPFEATNDNLSHFNLHESAGTGVLPQGDVVIHARITDPDFDVSGSGSDNVAQAIPDRPGNVDGYGPLMITVNRGASETLLGFAGGPVATDGFVIQDSQNRANINAIDVDQDLTDSDTDNDGQPAIEYGPIAETGPSSGVFELDLAIAWDHGPESAECPNDEACILQGDILEVEYTDPADASGNEQTVTDSATFDLRNGVLRSDKPVYVIGSDMILTLIEPDFDLDNDVAETYPLDLIEWDGDESSTVPLSDSVFDPEPTALRETGDSTGIFQVILEVPEEVLGSALERGEQIDLEYTDWGPAGSDYVGEDEEDIDLTVHTSDFGATIELDKAVYTWTDKVYITIVAPDHNFDSNLIDEIGEVGAEDELSVTTSFGGTLDNYRLVETGPDTGIFSGEVILTGYPHDADGDSQTGDNNGNDLQSSNPEGTGPTDGRLPADDDDGISISYEFNDNEYAVSSSLIRWNLGDVQWLEPSYPATASGVVRVIDPDMNWNPEAINNFEVDVRSDSDSAGINLTVTETQEASGIFEGTVVFSTTDRSSGHRLNVAEGDTITASYDDNTLPDPHTPNDQLEIKANTVIGTLVPPLSRAVIDNLRVTDNSGNALEQVAVGQQVLISAQLTSGQEINQEHVYIVQINDANDVTVSLSLSQGTLNAGQSFSPSVSWQPTAAGQYTATAFVWESIDNPTALSPTQDLPITVS